MAPVSHLLVAVMVISYANGQGQDDDNLDDEMAKCINKQMVTACPDYSQMVSCLENIDYLTDIYNHLQRTIDFYKLKRDECPGVSDKGKCAWQEVNACFDDFYSTKDCKRLETTIQCIDVVVTACNDSYAIQEKDFLTSEKAEYCDLSDAAKRCIDGVDECFGIVTYPELWKTGNVSSCDRTRSAHECLDKVEAGSVCNSTDAIRAKISNQREHIDEVDKVCQVARGPCTKWAMVSCTSIAYQGNIYPCPTSKVEEAKKCLDEMEPKCTTDYQKEVLETEWIFVARDCFYPLNTTSASSQA